MKRHSRLRAYSYWLRFGGIFYGKKEPRKTRKSYDAKNLNKTRECERRKRQIERGMLSPIWRRRGEEWYVKGEEKQ